jgi:exopolysaccharide production protein ExoQ
MASASTLQITSRIFVAPTTAERLLAGGVLLLSSGAFLSILRPEDSLTSGARTGSIVTDVIWITLYLVFLQRLYKNRRVLNEWLKLPWHVLALYAVVLASILWSEAPALSALKIVGLCGSLLIACYLAGRFTPRALMKMLATVLFTSMALSFLFALFVPTMGIGSGDFAGMWQGIYTHKNSLGLNMALAFMVFMVMATSRLASRVICSLAALAALLLVLLSRSSTSLVLCLVVLAVLMCRGLFRRHSRLIIALALALPIIAVKLDSDTLLNKGLELADRDPTLTGRTELWSAIVMVSERPWLGYGYGAFWRGADGPSFTVWKMANWEAFYSHNGFLDVWLDVGLVGLAILLMGIAISFRSAVVHWLADPSPENVWQILFLLYLFISNLTEGTLLAINVLPWILYLTVAIHLHRRRLIGVPAGATT